MLNDLFKKYQSHSFREIDIDRHHKKRLQDSLFKTGKTKIPFWTWTKAIFTAPMVAVVAIVFILSSNKPIIEHTFLPQEALAQSLENTFNLDTFETTFGLPSDGKFYHRVMTYHSNAPENHYGPYAETTDLWTDGKSVRRDITMLSDDATYRDFFSFLISAVDDANCSFVTFKECQPLAAFNQDQIKWFLDGNMPYKPADSEMLVSDLSVAPIYDGLKGPIYFLKWSTKAPVQSAEIMSGYDPMGGSLGFIDDPAIVLNPDKYSFVNVFQDGKYWHGTTLAIETNFIAKKQYFQIKNHVSLHQLDPHLIENGETQNHFTEESSMIYAIDRNGGVRSLTPDEFVEDMKGYNASTDAAKDLFHMGFQTAVFLLKHNNFSAPIFIQHIEKNNQNLIQIRYQMPEIYNRIVGYEGSKDEYKVDFFLDETQAHFVGYELIKNGTETESLWIKDEILPDAEKPNLFDQATWEASIADEYEAKEPERKQVLEDIEYQKATGEVRMHMEE